MIHNMMLAAWYLVHSPLVLIPLAVGLAVLAAGKSANMMDKRGWDVER